MPDSRYGSHLRQQRHKAVREAVDALYAARFAGDSKDFASYFAPDARLIIVANPALIPGAGMRLGREDIARHIDMLHEQNAYLSHTIDDVVIEDDQVIVVWSAEMRFFENGRTLSTQALDHMRVKDGMIVEMTQFLDSGGAGIAKGLIRIA